MSPDPSSELVTTDSPEHPEFRAVSLSLDPDTALEHIAETLKGIALNESDAGIKVRTTRGDLLAIVETGPEEESTVLHYRTAPASETMTLKARKLYQSLEPFEG